MKRIAVLRTEDEVVIRDGVWMVDEGEVEIHFDMPAAKVASNPNGP
jgi:hypothetical protein